MSFNTNVRHRRSIRLAGYDYRSAGAYFVSVCAARQQPVFGTLEHGEIRLNPYGQIVATEWKRMAELRAQVVLDEWIVMPNHFHGILFLCRGMACYAQDVMLDVDERVNDEGMASHAPTFGRPQSGSLAMVIAGFKSAVTRRINLHRAEQGRAPVVVWQRNYHERIIRDERELNQIRRYIIENPQNWAIDENNL